MALPLFWPGEHYFYPIGNTCAVSLTRDIPAEVQANILLLPCGDPRNVLFTVHCETPVSMARKLDFTCCDFDPGVLARNALLLTMIMDNIPQYVMWNVFFDMYLDDKSTSLLVEQCRKLVAVSGTMQDWLASPYGSVLRYATAYTLTQLRKVWTFYIDNAPPAGSQRARTLRRQIDEGRDIVNKRRGPGLVYSSARSSGPLLQYTMRLFPENFNHYWTTGTTCHDSKVLRTLSHANPTLLYSRLGEGFRVHYGTDPMAPVHLAPLFGNHLDTRPTASQMVLAAQAEFQGWCESFRDRATSTQGVLVVRFLLADALHAARAFDTWNKDTSSEKRRPSSIVVAPWSADLLELSIEEYTTYHAPTLFDVVDTSNLSDHVGFLNIFLATVPLLFRARPWSGVLYTECLLAKQSDPTTQLSSMLPADLTTIALTLGVCPIDSVSGFTTICNTHELLLTGITERKQFHQVLTWRRPHTGDPDTSSLCQRHPATEFEPAHIATALLEIYRRLFESEDPLRLLGTPPEGIEGTIAESAISTCSRETFVMLLRLLRAQVYASLEEERWSCVVELFFDKYYNTVGQLEAAYHQDLSAQLCRYQVHTFSIYHEELPALPGWLLKWTSVPALVRIYLAVPYNKFAVLRSAVEKIPTPVLQCLVRSSVIYENAFQSVNATFGTIIKTGTASKPSASIQAAEEGLNATRSSLIVSFVVPTWTLTRKGTPDPEGITVSLQVKPSLATTMAYMRTLGPHLSIFSAPLSNAQHVYIVPEEPLPMILRPELSKPSKQENVCPWSQTSVRSELNPAGNSAPYLTARLELEDVSLKKLFAERANPTVTQSSPCTMRVSLGQYTTLLSYPLPVSGDRQKTRLARKSSYIEVVVPVAMPYPDAWAMKINPFPVVREKNITFAWNMHRVPLDRLPVVDVGSAKHAKVTWVGPHVGSQLSQKERRMREEGTSDILGLVKDTIHAIIMNVTGLQTDLPRNLFALHDAATEQADTFLFISDLRYDIASHTVVCDGYVLTLCESLISAIHPPMSKLRDIVSVKVYGDELRAWKQLLPGLVERCRSTWVHGENCEYIAQGRIPLSLEINAGDPLCSCGRGKDVEGMRRVKAWKDLSPFVTRIALSPIFAVSYLEPVVDIQAFKSTRAAEARSPSSEANIRKKDVTGGIAPARPERCRKCSKVGGDLFRCSRCKSVYYCSSACQRGDWKDHRAMCQLRSGSNT